MADSHYLAKDKLINAMHGRSTTARWDILVSYKAEHLSKLLGELWQKDRNTDILQHKDPKIAFGRRQAYNLNLGSPKLGFESTDVGVTASLTIPISGTVSVELFIEEDDDKYAEKPYKVKEQIVPKDTYCLNISVPVKSLTGDASAADVDQKAVLSGKVVSLGEQQENKAHIILHFSSEKATYSVDPITKPAEGAPAVPVYLSEATQSIKTWFSNKENVDVINYRLATVKAIKDPSDASAILKPKSFIFVSNGDVLCIYVKTEGSGSEPGDPEARFTNIDGSTIRPIPEGSTASIIVSHRLLHEKVFLPRLQQYHKDCGNTNKEVTCVDNPKGFTYQFYLGGKFNVNMKSERSMWAQEYIPTVKVSLDAAVTTLKIEDNSATFSHTHDTNFEWHSSSLSFGPVLIAPTPDKGILTTTLAQTSTAAKVEDNSVIAIDLSIEAKSFTLTGKKPQNDTTYLAEGVKNAKVDFSPISLKSPNLNFIAAESILAPGQTIVNVKSIHMPYDLILVGEMVDKITG